MITPTQQIVCLIVSRQLIADQSPISCRPITTHFLSVGNQSPTSPRPIANWSPIFRDSCRCFLVARQSPTGCSTCVTGALLRKVEIKPFLSPCAMINLILLTYFLVCCLLLVFSHPSSSGAYNPTCPLWFLCSCLRSAQTLPQGTYRS